LDARWARISQTVVQNSTVSIPRLTATSRATSALAASKNA
jgi:hypothetical protein